MTNLSNTLSILSFLAIISTGLFSCGGEDGMTDPPILDKNGKRTNYVISKMKIPTTLKEATDLQLDIDGDGIGENSLGKVLATLATTANLELQTSIQEQLENGSFILLPSVQATDLSNANGVGTYIYFGTNPTPKACLNAEDPATCAKHLDGKASFDIDATSSTDSVAGAILNGELTGGPGKLSIQMPLGKNAPLRLDLVGARIETPISKTAINGAKLGGAITSEDIDTKLIPAVQGLLSSIVEEDCTPTSDDCGCDADSAGASVISFFDTNKDCKIPLEELKSNIIVTSSLKPDLDLFDAEGKFNPNSDGVPDSLSLAIGFDAVPAIFTPPTPTK